MAKEKKKVPAPAHGVQAAARRSKMERASQYRDGIWQRLNPLKRPPKVHHKTYFEAVENSDKKKKLEYQTTTSTNPPPGFEFVPIGNPELSKECKEICRSRDAMFFIVSKLKDQNALEHHMFRTGYHFRETIVSEARDSLRRKGHKDYATDARRLDGPEPIPESQREIDKQADAVLRDLFPRIPHTDRHEIIQHAFKKDGKFNGKYKVGTAAELSLARRVQLAALAHIRHTHTRYDELLKEASWPDARKATQQPCLDIIVKWRGDEETGRDQLDEILREVIEISDSEDDSEDDGEEDSSGSDDAHVRNARALSAARSATNRIVSLNDLRSPQAMGQEYRGNRVSSAVLTPPRQRIVTRAQRKQARKVQERFRRYAATAEALAGTRQPNGQLAGSGVPRLASAAMDPTLSQERDRAVESGPRLPSSAYPIPYNGRVLDHVETRPSSRLDGGSDQERTTAQTRAIPFIHTREPVPRGTCVPEGFQPKVGRPYASHSYPHSSLSPIRTGLQDMLLPSVEPASPSSVWGAQNATRGMHRESQQLAEPPRVLTRLPFDASRSHLRPRSPVSAEDNHELAAKRRRVVTYDHEGLDGRSKPSFIRIIHPEDHGNGYARLESSTARPPPHSTDRVVSPVGSWGIVRDNLTQHPRGFGPLRTRTNPIVVNEDSRYMPYAAESQGPPAGEIYERSSARAGGTMQGMLPSESRRIDDAPHVRYVGRPAPQPTFVSHSHQNGFDGAGIRPLPDRDSRLHSSVWQRHHEAAPLQSHSAAYYTEAVRPGQPVLAPMEFSGNSRREVRMIPRQPEHFDLHYDHQRGGLQEYARVPPQPQPVSRENLPYGSTRLVHQTAPEGEYRRDGKLSPVYTTGANHVYLPPQHRNPESRDVVWIRE